MVEIPVIDISGFLAGTDTTKAPAEVERAATELGFLQIVGHGVPASTIQRVYNAVDEISACSPERKAGFLSDGHPYRGFHMNRDAAGKVRQERFLVSRFDNAEMAIAGGVPADSADFFFPNQWPDLDGFRDAITGLFSVTNALAHRMMSLFALALGMEADWFDSMLEPNASTFAINHYPARGEAVGPEGPPVLFAEHADGNTLTILHQRGDYNGLQIRPLDGSDEWIDIPVVDDAFVINVGELMTHWTNDHWPSTRHRVVASTDPTAKRTTLTTFHMPALDATVAPLASCGGDVDPHYGPVTPYEWERYIMARNYKGRALEVDQKVSEFVEALRG